jgi:4-hydroxythreonine-4-phosphate dehydrogenase
MRPRIGITLGDPAGIGPEIVRAALASGRLPADADYVVLGEYPDCSLGQPTTATARAAAAGLEEAARLALGGEINGVVTGPIHKARMYEIGFEFPGQTEFFAKRCGVENFAMLLTGGKLTVALVTTHIPLAQVARSLRTDEIVRVGRLLEDFLRRRGIAKPRIAVAGLNPHAGESGAIGREEIDVIEPAVAQLQARIGSRGSTIAGPFSPDTIFYQAANGAYDAVLCMYHDQGLIPLKLHAFHEGVNVTLGLPFPRTSPDHGTAFDLAGKGIARADSMIAAINLAVELAAARE